MLGWRDGGQLQDYGNGSGDAGMWPRAPRLARDLVCGTRKHPAMREGLAAHRRFHLHFTPTSASWLNLIERWFALITEQAIRRGGCASVRWLEEAVNRRLTHWWSYSVSMDQVGRRHQTRHPRCHAYLQRRHTSVASQKYV